MQYDVTSPKEYLDALDSDWRRETLLKVRAMIGDQLEEGIEYKMLCYRLEGRSVFQLNAQKNYVSLYVGTIDKVPEAEELLKGLDRGKGCIRIKKSVAIAETQLKPFIDQVIRMNKEGVETGC